MHKNNVMASFDTVKAVGAQRSVFLTEEPPKY